MRVWILVAALAALFPVMSPASATDVATFVKKDQFNQIKISPTGEYLAMTVPVEDRTILAILRYGDRKVVGSFSLADKTHVQEF